MSELKAQGYKRYDFMKDLHYEGIEKDYEELRDYFRNDLPEDEYAKGLNRFRRYSRALVLPTSQTIEWLPNIKKDGKEYAAYFQGKFNPEHPGDYREFAAIDESILNNKLLQKIIMADYEETFWNEEDLIMPIHVGVHFVKLRVEHEDDIAVSSPNSLHQDGEPFTFAHLIERRNVEGGTNAIGIPEVRHQLPEDTKDGELHEVFEITKPLESYGVADHMVSHYVSPITRGEKDEEGLRSILLIDYQLTVVAEMDE